MSEQDDLNKISKAAQGTNNPGLIQWITMTLTAVAGAGSIPFIGSHEQPIVIVLLAVSIPIWSVIFHRKGIESAAPLTTPTGHVVYQEGNTKEPIIIPAPKPVRKPIVSDKLDTLYKPKPEQAIPPKTVAELLNRIPKTLMNKPLEEPEMVELPSNESKLLSLLTNAGKSNSGALVSAMQAKGKTPEEIMAQAAALLVAKYPQLSVYAGAEDALAAEMVKGAGSTEQAVLLANDLIMSETFGTIAEPTPAPTPKSVAYDEAVTDAAVTEPAAEPLPTTYTASSL